MLVYMVGCGRKPYFRRAMSRRSEGRIIGDGSLPRAVPSEVKRVVPRQVSPARHNGFRLVGFSSM